MPPKKKKKDEDNGLPPLVPGTFRPVSQPSSKRGNLPRGRVFKPGEIYNTVYLNAEWGYDLYRLMSEELSSMKELTDPETGESTAKTETQSREIRSLARVVIERIDQATGHRGLEGFEKTLNEGKIIQVPVTPKEQNFMLSIAESFDLGPEAIQELRTQPKQGHY